jgi:hypothetical protein
LNKSSWDAAPHHPRVHPTQQKAIAPALGWYSEMVEFRTFNRKITSEMAGSSIILPQDDSKTQRLTTSLPLENHHTSKD